LDRQQPADASLKPVGFWLSEETAWEDWCREEGFATSDNSVVYEATISPDASILKIDTRETLLQFQNRYMEMNPDITMCPNIVMRKIDWQRIAKDYDGIWVSNYNQLKRETIDSIPMPGWLWALDCSCMCVWRPRKVISRLVISSA
jgi:hypothetical protein